MAYNKALLNNIAGSCGRANLWIYDDTGNNVATLKAANYFAGSVNEGMRMRDTIILCGSDGTAIGKMNALSSTTSSITAFLAI